MKLDLFDLKGGKSGEIEIEDSVFGIPVNEAVVHQALVRQLANRRQGTADTQVRADVSRSSKKMYQQKHTGRARRGSMTSPLMKGGSVIFGPHPRSYRLDMPKKMRRLAIRSVLSGKVRDGELKVVQKWEMDQPKTKNLVEILKSLGVGSSAIIGVALGNDTIVMAASNLEGIKITRVTMLNVADMLSHKMLILDVDAVRRIEELWGQAGKKERKQVN